jgi:hypothetical protein
VIAKGVLVGATGATVTVDAGGIVVDTGSSARPQAVRASRKHNVTGYRIFKKELFIITNL